MTVDLHTLRERLASTGSDAWWRGLDEVAETPAFQEFLHREFPEDATEWTNPVTRRRFLVLAGASLGLAGLAGCGRIQPPVERIMPYVRQPAELVPGRPMFYATAMTLSGFASGLLVESHEGRPTKIEGNPDHPVSRGDGKFGPTDSFAQASILDLYDPERSQAVTYLGRPRAWGDALAAFQAELKRKGEATRLRILTETVSSPSLAAQIDRLLKKLPRARWHSYEPINDDASQSAARQAFGEEVHTYYSLKDADVILSLDADFLSCGPAHLRYVREFADRRRLAGGTAERMNRLYVVEPMPTSTGASADHRLPLRADQIDGLARAVAVRLGVKGVTAPAEMDERQKRWVAAVGDDLKKHAGSCVVIPGAGQSASVHALAHAMNEALGNRGRTVILTDPVVVTPPGQKEGQVASLADLVSAMEKKEVDLLLILGGNPVYTAPADLRFEKQMANVPFRVHLGSYQDETAVQCHWHLPAAHYLEAWGDARAYDGTASIIQPLIAPLYDGRSALEVLPMFTDGLERPGHEMVRDHWRQWRQDQKQSGDFEVFWQTALNKGVVDGTAAPRITVTLRNDGVKLAEAALAASELEVVFRPDPAMYDGRYANNSWLQELPRPVTKLTWDNAAFLSPKTAEKFGIAAPRPGKNGGEHGQAIVDVVGLTLGSAEPLNVPVWVLPGHADDCVTLPLGFGRTRAGKVGDKVGFDAYRLRTTKNLASGTGLKIRKIGETHVLACTQMHHSMEGRDIVRSGTLEEYHKDEALAPKKSEEERDNDPRLIPLTMFPPHEYKGYKWGMAVDLSACVGCSACVVACQSENNIPVVGKEEVTRAREMHWLRIDRYYRGNLDNPDTYFQPVPCMHCENAPCEIVCPVAATVHSGDGLNEMIYNRCVGTRYCSNNCPYKVRRFNFLQFADYATKSLKLMRNPDVTVRTRGVMEKCTYCVQRIREAEITAEKEDRRIRDGEVVTACQAACPAQAIVFGDLNDPKARVTKLKAEPRNYGLLADLNTQPRTTYLAAVRNPNPELV